MTAMFSSLVVWHDVECGRYSADLALWAELAGRERGPVLDVGAGTGRVALPLARAGHDVTALDREPELLEALATRAQGLPIATVVADAGDFALDRRFGLVIVPMQTIQLLPTVPRSSPPRIATCCRAASSGSPSRPGSRTSATWRASCPRPTSRRSPTGASRRSRRRCARCPARRGSSASAARTHPTAA